MQKITVQLTSGTSLAPAKVKLSELFSQEAFFNSTHVTLDLEITIAPQVVVELVDDLISFEQLWQFQLLKQKIVIVVGQEAIVTYRARIAPGKEVVQEGVDFNLKIIDQAQVGKELVFRLVGTGAQVNAVVSCFGAGSRFFKFKTLQDHVARDARSNLLIKGVLDDASKLMCSSMIRVHKDAQHTDAFQANKNILLSKGARATSIPQLEIEANEVKCKHGAAVSALNDEHIFYLASRGITPNVTRNILIEGFLSE